MHRRYGAFPGKVACYHAISLALIGDMAAIRGVACVSGLELGSEQDIEIAVNDNLGL
jgi:hypothetical protein